MQRNMGYYFFYIETWYVVSFDTVLKKDGHGSRHTIT